MSTAPSTTPLPCGLGARGEDDGCDPPLIVEALADEDARAVFLALEEPRTAAEIREACDLSTSSAYRKLERLADAGLIVPLEDRSGTATRYAKAMECISVTYDEPIRIECLKGGVPLYCEVSP